MNPDRPKIFSLIDRDTWIWLVIGLVCLTVYAFNYVQSSTWASLNIKYSRDEITSIAKKYALAVGYKPIRRSSIRFSRIQEAKTFLELEKGVEKSNQLIKSEKIPVWQWRVWLSDNKTSDGNVAVVRVGTEGELHSIELWIEKDKYGASLFHDQAKEKIKSLVRENMGDDLNQWVLVTDRTSKLKKSVEHKFVWEDRRKDFSGGRMQISATVIGRTITSLKKYLHPPDKFTHKYQVLRAENDALSTISFSFIYFFYGLIPILFCWFVAQKQIRIKFTIYVWIAVALACYFTRLNNLFSKLIAYQGFDIADATGSAVHGSAIGSLLLGLLVAVSFSTVEVLYRKAFPEKIALENIISGKALNSKLFLNNSLKGAAFFGFMAVYSYLFWAIGARLGVYIPVFTNEAYIESSFCPIWDSVFLGLEASSLEEILMRALIFIIVNKLTKSFWIANFAQALIWGFAHCNYPMEPPYIRGVELTIMGLIFGCILKKYGLIPGLIAHYAFDVCVTSISLYCSGNPYDLLMALSGLSPLIIIPIASIILIRRKGLADDSQLLNKSVEIPELDQTLDRPTQDILFYRPLSTRVNVILSIVFIISVAGLFLPVDSVGKISKLSVSRSQAIAIAKKYFSNLHVDTKNMNALAKLYAESKRDTIQYLYENEGLEAASKRAQILEPRLYWVVTLLHPGEQNSYQLIINKDGEPVSQTISLSDQEPGSNISKKEAERKCKEMVAKHLNIDVKEIEVKLLEEKDYQARTDYDIVLNIPKLKVKDAEFHVSLNVVGDELSAVDYYWKLPENFTEKRKESRSNYAALAVFLGILAIYFGWWTLKNYKLKRVNWIIVLIPVLILMMNSLLSDLNSAVITLRGSTSEALHSYYASNLISIVSSTATQVILFFFLITIVATLKSDYFSRNRTASIMPLLKQISSQPYFWNYGILLGLLVSMVWQFIHHFEAIANNLILNEVTINTPLFVTISNNFCPAFAAFSRVLTFATGASLASVIFYHWAKKTNRGFLKLIMGTIIVSLVFHLIGGKGDLKALVPLTFNLLLLFTYYIFVMKVGKMNWAASFFSFYFLVLGNAIYGLYQFGLKVYPLNFAALVLLFLAPLAFVLFNYRNEFAGLLGIGKSGRGADG